MSDALVAALRAACGEAAVITDPSQVQPFVTDWRGAFTGDAVAVVRPATTQQVSETIRACAGRATVIPQGGNTGLAAGATPLELDCAVVLNLARMRRIGPVDGDGYTITVDAGAVLCEVQEAAERAQRFFPLSLAAEGSAQIGGLISTNAGGTAVLRYGSMRSLVLGLEVVLADGRIVDGLRALYKDNAGYDWKQLFIGAEGTLGVITRAVLRVFPQPRARITALAGVTSCEDALRLFSALRSRLGETLTACELFPERAVAMRLEDDARLSRPIARHPWYVLIEAASTLTSLRDEAVEALASIQGDGFASDIVVAENGDRERALWEWRETITETEKRAGRSLKHDVSVALSAIPAFITRATERIERSYPGTRVLAFGHLGDGNIHFNVVLPPDDSVDTERLSGDVYTLIADFRGSITAEHGIGRYRRDELPAHRSSSEMHLLEAIKNAIDPNGVFNPGAVLSELRLRGQAQ